MFINCPNCGALVATDLATDLPPESCPRCGFALRRDPVTPAPTEAASRPPAAKPPPAPTPAVATAQPPSAAMAATETVAPTDAGTDTTTGTVASRPLLPADARASTEADADIHAVDADEQTDAAASQITAASARADATPETTAPDAMPPAAAAPPPADAGSGAKTIAAPSGKRIAPSFAHGAPRAGGAHADTLRRRWPALAAVAGLTLLLALQLMLADRARLAADPQWRPLLESTCAVLRCSLPPWREPAAIVLLQRDVRPHPQHPGALRVNATIRNDARWPQAWPDLTFILSDVDGRALGSRRFSPEEYLAGPLDAAGMSSGQLAAIRMEVLEPSPHTVAFHFDFR